MKRNRIRIVLLLALTLFLPTSELLSRLFGFRSVIYVPLATALVLSAVYLLLYVLLVANRDKGIGSVMWFVYPLLPLFSALHALVWIFMTDDVIAAVAMCLWVPVSVVCTLLLRCSIPLKAITSVLSFLIVIPALLFLWLGASLYGPTDTVVRSRSVSPTGMCCVEVVDYTSVDVHDQPIVLSTRMRVYQRGRSLRVLSLEWRCHEQVVALKEGEEDLSIVWLNETTFALTDSDAGNTLLSAEKNHVPELAV